MAQQRWIPAPPDPVPGHKNIQNVEVCLDDDPVGGGKVVHLSFDVDGRRAIWRGPTLDARWLGYLLTQAADMIDGKVHERSDAGYAVDDLPKRLWR